jgi:hypothetical protein
MIEVHGRHRIAEPTKQRVVEETLKRRANHLMTRVNKQKYAIRS